MIVIGRRAGRLGNNLILFSHVIAAAIEHGAQAAHPGFYRYARHFRGPRADLLCRFPARAGGGTPSRALARLIDQAIYGSARSLAALRCRRFPLSVIRLAGGERYDLDCDEFERLARKRRPTVILGWEFRGPTNVARHAESIREYFRPIEAHEAAAAEVVARARGAGDVLVGIHVRQGDYKTFRGGRYFFTPSQYAAAMRRMADLLSPRRAAFLVCSDAALDAADFPGLRVSFGAGHFVEDLYSFAACDYLLGPPSTFSAWASFYGRTPLRVLESRDNELRLDQFHVNSCAQAPDDRLWRDGGERESEGPPILSLSNDCATVCRPISLCARHH
jgi:hypothetical protein